MINSTDALRRGAVKFASFIAWLGVLAAVTVCVVLSPAAIGVIFQGNHDWAQAGNIGQAYGAASALLSTIALWAVVFSLSLQRRQLHQERIWLHRDLHLNIVKIALVDPMYAQCWGPRVSPPSIDERLFYYTNLIILEWSYAWDHCDLSEEQLRKYSRGLFESEVSREYWSRFGEWRSAPGTMHHQRFLRIMSDEYDKSVAAGPPSRPHESASDRQSANGLGVASPPDPLLLQYALEVRGGFRRPRRGDLGVNDQRSRP